MHLLEFFELFSQLKQLRVSPIARAAAGSACVGGGWRARGCHFAPMLVLLRASEARRAAQRWWDCNVIKMNT
jgi:hypothetical protein|tara:strand:+ start:235 stop:450 length:216 start_codon:yes stop_codon:yes gene_type:complete